MCKHTVQQWYSTWGTRVICDTLPLFLRDTFDTKMLRKCHPGKPITKYKLHAKPYHLYICIVCIILVHNLHCKRTQPTSYNSTLLVN